MMRYTKASEAQQAMEETPRNGLWFFNSAATKALISFPSHLREVASTC